MIRTLTIAVSMLALAATLSLADPGVSLRMIDGAAVVTLDGAWQGYSYNAFKGAPGAAPEPLLSDYTLCTGSCSVTDYDVEPGATYSYRFDLYAGDGSVRSYGPFAVTIPGRRTQTVGAALSPNPSRGPATIELRVPGRTTDPRADVEVAIYDPQGRRLRAVFSGPVARGVTRIGWDGRDDRGAMLGTGIYFLLVRSPLGSATTRVLRVR